MKLNGIRNGIRMNPWPYGAGGPSPETLAAYGSIQDLRSWGRHVQDCTEQRCRSPYGAPIRWS